MELWSPFHPGINADWDDYWRAGGHHWKRIRHDLARSVVRVDTAAFEALPPPSRACYEYGSFGERNGQLTGGLHPCGQPNHLPCAIQWAGLKLAHLYGLWLPYDAIWLHEIPRARRASLTRAISRARDPLDPSQPGNYYAAYRADTSEHYVYSSVPPEPSAAFARTATELTPAQAWHHARDIAFRIPFLTSSTGRRTANSRAWTQPVPPSRDITYGKGLTDDELREAEWRCELYAWQDHRKWFEKLPPQERQAIGTSVNTELISERGVPWT